MELALLVEPAALAVVVAQFAEVVPLLQAEVELEVLVASQAAEPAPAVSAALQEVEPRLAELVALPQVEEVSTGTAGGAETGAAGG